MNRRTFLRATTLAALALPPALRAGEPPARPDTDLLAEARERIARHRRRRGTLVLRTAAGRPLAGARVRVEQTRHEFLFGCNLFMFDRCGEAEAEAAYRERFAALLNFATLGFYWASYERERGQPNYAYTDRVLEWTRARDLRCKGHPLVWDHPAGSPRWLPEDDEELARLSDGRVQEIVARFKGRLDTWDVVNEATHLPDHVNQTRMARWGEKLGPVAYTRRALEIARAAHPAATLLVNDYRLEPRHFKLLDALRDAEGRPLFDAVGLQSHMHDRPWRLARVWEVCDTFAPLGRPLHFTETTVVSGPRLGPGENWGPTTPELEARQAEYVEQFYTMVFAHPATQALTWWDFSDRGAWQRAAAGLVRRDMSPKPVYDRLHALIKGQWWTRAELTANEAGEVTLDAFHGTHRLTIQAGSTPPVERELVWRSGGPDRLELTL
jgi:GH35 family endo-1,4-beta-xylanase